MHHEDETAAPAATWRDQLIELDLPGVGPITASADPQLLRDAGDVAHTAGAVHAADAAHAMDAADSVHAADAADEVAFRRRQPTTPPSVETVRSTLQARPPLELEHTWLVLPALGPVLPTLAPDGMVVADVSGARQPLRGTSAAGGWPGAAQPGGRARRGPGRRASAVAAAAHAHLVPSARGRRGSASPGRAGGARRSRRPSP